jgi:hypothetical protein
MPETCFCSDDNRIVECVMFIGRNGGDICGNCVECWPVERSCFRFDEMIDCSSIANFSGLVECRAFALFAMFSEI